MKCADMKRHRRKRMKKMDAERGLTLLMSAINSDSFDFFFFWLLHWFLVTFGIRLELVPSTSV